MKTRNSTIVPSTSSLARLSHQENENNNKQLATQSPSSQCNNSSIASESSSLSRRRSPRLKVAAGTSKYHDHSSPTSESPTHREGLLLGDKSKYNSAIATPDNDRNGNSPLPSGTKVVPMAILNNEVVDAFIPREKKQKTADSSSATNSKALPKVRMVSSDDDIDTAGKLSSSSTILLPSNVDLQKSGNTWILEDGLDHIKMNGLHKFVDRFGPPSFYTSPPNKVNPQVSPKSEENKACRSLFRIIAGQQLSATSATAIWTKLLNTVGSSPSDPSKHTPAKIMSYAKKVWLDMLVCAWSCL